jgi:hypothetical protein
MAGDLLSGLPPGFKVDLLFFRTRAISIPLNKPNFLLRILILLLISGED